VRVCARVCVCVCACVCVCVCVHVNRGGGLVPIGLFIKRLYTFGRNEVHGSVRAGVVFV